MYLIVGKYISECPITCIAHTYVHSKSKKIILNIYRLIGRNPPPGLVYADSKTYSGPDEDISFDQDDELVFMARHLGTRKAKQDEFIFNVSLGNHVQAKLRSNVLFIRSASDSSLVFLLISNLTNELRLHQFLVTKSVEANKSVKTDVNGAH